MSPNESQHGDHQLTLRAIVTGFACGGLFSLTNLYVSAKAGATFGMGMSASLLAFSLFHVTAGSTRHRRLFVLENNLIQTIAGAGGYMASALTANLAALIVVQDQVLPWWQAMLWCIALSCFGLVMAIPHKRRFVNDLAYPFPEGQACAAVLSTLHDAPMLTAGNPPPGRAETAHGKAWKPTTALVYSALAAGFVKLLQSGSILNRLRLSFCHLPEELDQWYVVLARKYDWPVPQLSGVPWMQLTIRPTLDIAMLAVGGMMGIRLGASLLAGAILNYVVLVPWMITRGAIPLQFDAHHMPIVGYRAISAWSLWSGVALMTVASLTAFLMQWLPRTRHNSRGTRNPPKVTASREPGVRAEIPIACFWIGLLVLGAGIVWMAHAFFGVSAWLTLVIMPVVYLMAAVGIHATALTSITPTGAVARVTQLCGGILVPRQTTPNIILGSITAETTMHAATFCQHLRPGYLLGASPRVQAIGHLLGTLAGALCCVPVFYRLILRDQPASLITDKFPFPAANVWIGVSKIMSDGLGTLPPSAAIAAAAAAVVGVILAMPISRRLPVSPVGLGLAFLIPFHVSLAIFAGAALFWWVERQAHQPRPSAAAFNVWQHRDVICAGLMMGAALVGIVGLACDHSGQ